MTDKATEPTTTSYTSDTCSAVTHVEEPGSRNGVGKEEEATRQRPPLPTFAAKIFSNRQIVAVLSDLIAILEHIKYEERPKGKRVFQTDWARNLFKMSLTADMQREFDVESWYDFIAAKNPVKQVNEFTGVIDSSLYNADIKTDWVLPLIHLESMSYGFISMFHGILSLEKQSHLKMNQYSKLECQSETYGMGKDDNGDTGSGGSGGGGAGKRDASAAQRVQFIGWHS